MKRMNIRLKFLVGCMALNTRMQIFLENEDGNVYAVSDEETLYNLNGKKGLEPVFFNYYVIGITYFIDHLNILISEEGETNV